MKKELTEQEKKAYVYANEQTAMEFVRRMVKKPEWVPTRTVGEYADWDVTVTNDRTGKEVLIENKIRNVDADDYRDEGALVDVEKVEKVRANGHTAYVNQYFHLNNETYSWPMSEAENWKENGWKKVKRWCYEHSWDVGDPTKKVLKWVYLLPMDEKYRVLDIDISDCQDLRKNYYAEGLKRYAKGV